MLMYIKPDELEYPPQSLDHVDHISRLTLNGYTKIAADHILHSEMQGYLEETVGNVVRQLTTVFNHAFLNKRSKNDTVQCQRICDTLVNMALNLLGFEKEIVGFSDAESKNALSMLRTTLKYLETIERKDVFGGEQNESSIARVTIDNILSEMKTVMKGVYRPPGALVAQIASDIEKKIDSEDIFGSFLRLAEEHIQNNIYYRLSVAGLCKFGNDYALGLRWLRHLGFVQVSTNPSLAAIAYEDDPSQWIGYCGENFCPDFYTIIKQHQKLCKSPEENGDEITAYATEVSIWRNLAVFRPIAIASKMFHGLVSLQLNPEIADNYENSVKYALKFYHDAEKFLKFYDTWLLWGYSKNIERGRPNIVFKIAANSPASIEITRKLESLGIGTNNTVTFTVSQETELILAKIKGRSEAIKKGIPLTTVYETNMGGRLDDHIREVQAEKLVKKALERERGKEKALEKLAEELGALNEIREKNTLTEKITVVCSRKYLRPINKEPMIRFLASHHVPFTSEEQVKSYLETLENDIGYCGLLVTKRVYEIFFDPQNRQKWITYLQKGYGLTEKQAEQVLNGIDILPASKRHPKETLLALASRNMTHTEFPNHQTAVATTFSQMSFRIENCRESVLKPVDQDILERLTSSYDVKDEVAKFLELTESQLEILKEAKIDNCERYGSKGLSPLDWGSFGAVIKTMDEFSNSYKTFKAKCIEFVRKKFQTKN